jgi:hypothetical protein
MADAIETVERFLPDRALEIRELPRRAPQRDALRTHEGDAGGVVAAILHAAQTVEENGDDGFRTDVSNDPAHG